AIKGMRWLLGMHSRNRTKAHTRLLNQLRKSNRRIYRAWVLKDEFEQFWNYRYPGAARAFLKRWMTATLKSRIASMREFVGTLAACVLQQTLIIGKRHVERRGELTLGGRAPVLLFEFR